MPIAHDLSCKLVCSKHSVGAGHYTLLPLSTLYCSFLLSSRFSVSVKPSARKKLCVYFNDTVEPVPIHGNESTIRLGGLLEKSTANILSLSILSSNGVLIL